MKNQSYKDVKTLVAMKDFGTQLVAPKQGRPPLMEMLKTSFPLVYPYAQKTIKSIEKVFKPMEELGVERQKAEHACKRKYAATQNIDGNDVLVQDVGFNQRTGQLEQIYRYTKENEELCGNELSEIKKKYDDIESDFYFHPESEGMDEHGDRRIKKAEIMLHFCREYDKNLPAEFIQLLKGWCLDNESKPYEDFKTRVPIVSANGIPKIPLPDMQIKK